MVSSVKGRGIRFTVEDVGDIFNISFVGYDNTLKKKGSKMGKKKAWLI